MPDLQQLREEFSGTDVNEWSFFSDPDVWANTEEDFNIRVTEPFTEDALHPVTNQDLGEVYGDVDRGLGNIRVEYRGVPFYEADFIVVGRQDERRYFPHGITKLGSKMNKFQEHIGRVMTESLDYRDYDEVLETIEQADELG